MDLNPFFKSVLEQDTAAIVLCDLNHTIVYMNPRRPLPATTSTAVRRWWAEVCKTATTPTPTR